MKKYIHYIALLMLAGFFASCDSAKYPIDSAPYIKIDPRLLGTWKAKGKHEEFTLIKQTDYRYLILYRNRRHDDIEKYPAFFSDISGVRFLNIYSQDDSSTGYAFLKIIDINMIKNVVTVAAVSDTGLINITEPGGVRERITSHLHDKAYYTDTTYFFRIR